MMRSSITAKTGMIAQQAALDVHANNLANVNTAGYKARQAVFSDTLYSSLNTPGQPEITVGSGVRVSQTAADMGGGFPVQTNLSLDYFINGEGYFALLEKNGDILYSRDGHFAVSAEADGSYLVSAGGEYVLNADNNKINLLAAQPDASVQPGIFNFDNQQGLLNAGQNLYTATDESGKAKPIQGKLVQGELEGSNVDLSLEMTKVMMAQRAYQFNAKVAQIADETEQAANNLGGR